MTFFWPAIGAAFVVIILLAWLSDHRAKRKGLPNSSETIARNMKEFKRERRQRLMIMRRTWIPTDDPREHRPPGRPNHYPPG